MADAPSHVKPRRIQPLKLAGRLLFGLAAVGMIGWAMLALYFSNLPGWLWPVVAAAFLAASARSLLFMRDRWRGRGAFLALFVLLVAWWLSIPPLNHRDWQPDVVVLPYAEIEGNKVTVHNIRNCDYRSETDFDVRHYDRAYDLDRLRTVDLYVIYWGSPLIAHTMMSFGFEGDEYLCISIETRKEKGEQYSAVAGFFRQYELTYVVADERDLVRLRTNYRGEDVYLYRLHPKPDVLRSVFLSYITRVNSLRDRPEWYNALTQNCTTSIYGHTRPYAKRSSFSWKLLLNGHVDEMAYDNGTLDQSLPFAELKARSHINSRGQAAGQDPAFSMRIREGLPGMETR